MNASPCLSCTRVKDPRLCENKECRVWRRWFVEKWDALRRAPRVQIEQLPKVMEGEVIGGQQYALPHRVRAYLDTDPCEKCVCPKDLCKPQCRINRDWLKAREDVLV